MALPVDVLDHDPRQTDGARRMDAEAFVDASVQVGQVLDLVVVDDGATVQISMLEGGP
jgi:hypothetical protein